MTKDADLQKFLQKYYQSEQKTIELIKEKISKEKKERNFISLTDYYIFQVKEEIKKILDKSYPQINIEENDFNLEEPPLFIKGDF